MVQQNTAYTLTMCNELPLELRMLIVSFIPSKATARIDALVKYLSKGVYVTVVEHGEDYSILGCREKCQPDTKYAFRDAKGCWGRFHHYWTIGTRRAMRLQWASHIEDIIEYVEEEFADNYDLRQNEKRVWETHPFDEYITDTCTVDKDEWYYDTHQKYYIHRE